MLAERADLRQIAEISLLTKRGLLCGTICVILFVFKNSGHGLSAAFGMGSPYRRPRSFSLFPACIKGTFVSLRAIRMRKPV